MSKLRFDPKDPADVLDYTFEFAEFLGDADEIVSATVTADQSGLVVGNPLVSSTAVVAWLSGGAPGSYNVSCTITTQSGRIARRSAALPVSVR